MVYTYNLCNFPVNIKLSKNKIFIHKMEGAVVKWNQYKGRESLHFEKILPQRQKERRGEEDWKQMFRGLGKLLRLLIAEESHSL